jgi:hypothetical protein
MTILNLDKSITVEFHSEDRIERKMLGLWADERFKLANLGMRIVNENVVITMGQYFIAEIPMTLFDQLAVKELAEIIIEKAQKKFT